MPRSTQAESKKSSQSQSSDSFREAAGDEAFRIEHLGEIHVIVPSAKIESLQWELIEEASGLLVAPLSRIDGPQIIVDLKDVDYFGSVFLSLLLRVERCVRKQGGEMVLCSASARAKELLRITNLDTIWAIYENRQEALRALGSD